MRDENVLYELKALIFKVFNPSGPTSILCILVVWANSQPDIIY